MGVVAGVVRVDVCQREPTCDRTLQGTVLGKGLGDHTVICCVAGGIAAALKDDCNRVVRILDQ
jgi:hypothetical protein